MASEEITNETAEQPVEAATPAPVAETPAAAVSAPEEIKKPEPRKDIFAELGLGGDDDKPKILKGQGQQKRFHGRGSRFLHVQQHRRDCDRPARQCHRLVLRR